MECTEDPWTDESTEDSGKEESARDRWTEAEKVWGIVLWEEPPWCYVKGGFHPVCIGDSFKNGRYTIRHKLGYGSSSTVWLAKDQM
jgi:hypothetical protein